MQKTEAFSVEKNVHVSYYLFKGKIYELSIRTDNFSVFDMLLDAYMKKFNYPKDEFGNYKQEWEGDYAPPKYRYTVDFKNVSFRTSVFDNSEDAPSLNIHDNDFSYGDIYSIYLIDNILDEARRKYEEEGEDRMEEEYKQIELQNQRKDDSLNAAIGKQAVN